MKEFTWNSDTIEYLKELYAQTDDYYRKIEEFVKYECDLEDGETNQELNYYMYAFKSGNFAPYEISGEKIIGIWKVYKNYKLCNQ
tara:strand:- start:112 stop:366 length:255 start_codon:yes stop_codon:yes gene_type:complete